MIRHLLPAPVVAIIGPALVLDAFPALTVVCERIIRIVLSFAAHHGRHVIRVVLIAIDNLKKIKYATATGRLDGVAYLLGLVAGTVVYAESYGGIKDLVNAGAMGAVTLPEALGTSWGLVVFGVVVIAVAGFYGATAIERRFGGAP